MQASSHAFLQSSPQWLAPVSWLECWCSPSFLHVFLQPTAFFQCTTAANLSQLRSLAIGHLKDATPMVKQQDVLLLVRLLQIRPG